MKLTLNLDNYDFDGTPKNHQHQEQIAKGIGKEINDKIRQVMSFQDEHLLQGGNIKITVEIIGPDMNKADTKTYNDEYDFHFHILESDRVIAFLVGKNALNPDHLTKTEKSYLQEIINHDPDKIIAKHHGRSVGTARTHRQNIYLKTGTHNPEDLKIYEAKHKLLG
ncbi:MAG: hypothetical protein WCL14_07925 [Bacteroidota bacterium]